MLSGIIAFANFVDVAVFVRVYHSQLIDQSKLLLWKKMFTSDINFIHLVLSERCFTETFFI